MEEGLPRDPHSIANVMSEWMALKGHLRPGSQNELERAWRRVAAEWGEQTRPVKVTRGVLQVHVAHVALLSQLKAFHAEPIAQRLKEEFPQLKVKSVKFVLADRPQLRG